MSFMQQFRVKQSVVKRSKKYLEEALYRRLFKDGGSKVSVRYQLHKFLKTRKRVYKWEVGHTIKILRQRRRFFPALRLSQTMEKRGMNKTVSDQAMHLDIVAKSLGIDAAEDYFIGLPEASKNHLTYGALLNCYCKELMSEKAEDLFKKMKELEFSLNAMPYNSMMTLYTKTGQLQKILSMIEEMKANDITPDIFTYNVWMRGLAADNDISGVERVIDEMKRDNRVEADWTTYSNLASIYINADLFEKGEKALKELEKKNARRDLSAYQFLITLYGRTGNLLEVYRVWRSLRLAFPKTANISYLNMIKVLVNLKDLPGAEKCFREWESSCSVFDIRIANILIGSYVKGGEIAKAEELKERMKRRGCNPNAKTWEILTDYYLEKGNTETAVGCIGKGIMASRGEGGKWVPSGETVERVMGQFEEKKDVNGAEGFLQILEKENEKMEEKVFETLLRIYAGAGKKNPTLRRRMKMEKLQLNEEAMKLLDSVCVE
ncbi:pentatricopeptide repeat-containing protein At1g60770 [Impatiens glandulifera]|uniref:pentatricopeptide repeat-containing protein At1g60770 n=1 Tax=Impatiens glandulifera TaxID=253017 RepID=UPI001FB07910|nr:pentatricopeptide repeat-containing protein At1g60770 [Impatiens glandulifera]